MPMFMKYLKTSGEIKAKNDALVEAMVINDEIPVKVDRFLKDGECKLSKYHHLPKTHKIPSTLEDPSTWLEDKRDCL